MPLAGVSFSTITSSAQIDPGVIVNSDINAAAAIEYSKLNSGSVNASIIPDVTNTRALGSPTHYFDGTYIQNLYALNCAMVVRPNADNTLALGAPSRRWTAVYVNAIEGQAKNQILVYGLLGGLS